MPVENAMHPPDGVDTSEYLLWQAYWKEAERFWSKNSAYFKDVPSTKHIYVELLFDSPNASVAQLFIGKYLQMRTGCEIVGHVEHMHTLATQTARSFGVTRFVTIGEDERDRARTTARHIFDGLPDRPESLRNAVLALEVDRIALGDLVYDWYLRRSCNPTIRAKDEVLQEVIAQAIARLLFIRRLCADHTFMAGVVTHRVYATFGTIVRALVARGVPVYARKPGGKRFTIRKYTSLEETRHHEWMTTPDEISHFSNDRMKAMETAGRKWIERRFSGKEHLVESASFLDGYASDKLVLTRAELGQHLHIDAESYTVALISHALTDEVHSGSWQVHDDYYLWLKHCLEIAHTRTDINWIVKAHPDNLHYHLHGVEQRLMDEVGHAPHIKLLPESVGQSTMVHAVDAVATVRGMAGVEFAACGKTIILAGESFYSQWNFGHQPKSKPDFSAMLGRVDQLPPMTPDEVRRARLAVAMRYIYTMVDCAFLIPCSFAFWNPTPNVDQLAGCLKLLRQIEIKDDPLYQNLNRQVDEGWRHMCNYQVSAGDILAWVD